jgi:hypothetical protein
MLIRCIINKYSIIFKAHTYIGRQNFKTFVQRSLNNSQLPKGDLRLMTHSTFVSILTLQNTCESSKSKSLTVSKSNGLTIHNS